MIITEENSPSRITEEEDILRAIRSELIEDAVEAFVVSVGGIDVPVDELLELVRAKYVEERARTN
ncbi:GntR family transcriptional regulator [Paenibacillus alvei TS-15]|uniref:GntR family transcriptional regulator n=1 Tax=Paenibacillus alvei TS-15 TaxID=1117108 RepID=S9TNB9_PAEAL|nr:hypothetical protein [Paenibacillus alvei]EPY03806.1 GntR family transcriptional regulator [Paenibacillus alvei TS-15]